MTPVTNSELGCFQRCQREWQHRYVHRRDGLVAAETLSRGKRIHVALARWWAGGSMFEEPLLSPIERAMLLGYVARYERPHLRNIRVNVAFRTTIGGADVVGECDAVCLDDEGRTVIVEHKTTSRGITPGSAWWRERVHCDPQPSTYLAAFPGATVLYDVLHVPSLRQLEVNSKRKEPESDESYIARILGDMSENPGKHFQRATVVRMDAEREAFEHDVRVLGFEIAHTRDSLEEESDSLPARNPHACFQFGRACDFFEVCWEGRDIGSYPEREKNHSEEIAEKYEASFRQETEGAA